MNNVSALSGLFADWYWETDDQLRLTHTSPEFAEKTGLDPADDFWEHNRRTLERHEAFRDFEIQRLHGRTKTEVLFVTQTGSRYMIGARYKFGK